MIFDEAIDALRDPDTAADAMRWLLGAWDESAPGLRAMLERFVAGADDSERTSVALTYAVHLLAEQRDTASFEPFCRLLHDPDRAGLVIGDGPAMEALPSLLVSLFDGRLDLLLDLITDPAVQEETRCDAFPALAYLARTQAVPEGAVYAAMAAMPDRLDPQGASLLWYGWVAAVMMLGFAGLAGRAEQLIRQGWVPDGMIDAPLFWEELNAARASPGDMVGPEWDRVGLFWDSIGYLTNEAEDEAPVAAPVRNALRDVGRNDPCPCGSGKKYKKCCLAA